MKRKFGWIPDIPDHRDYQFYRILPEIKLPPITNIVLGRRTYILQYILTGRIKQ